MKSDKITNKVIESILEYWALFWARYRLNHSQVLEDYEMP